MAHSKKSFLKVMAFILMIAVITISFKSKAFVFEGGTINNPNIVIAPNTRPPQITATNASGCGGAITYQWQQSPDGKNFIDIPGATATSYQPVVVLITIQFRRKAICSGDTVYTKNVATIMVQ